MASSRPSRERPVYTLRLAQSERKLIEAAAVQRGEYLSEYLRRASITAARRDLTSGQLTGGAATTG